MKTKQPAGRRRPWAALAAAALVAVAPGCQDTGGTRSEGGGCNPAMGALVGGAIGALVGGVAGEHGGGKKYAIGAAIGAGAGALACVAFNAHSRQTQSAGQVSQTYGSQHGGRQPPNPVVTAYRVHVDPAGGVQPGQTATVVSNMTVVDGASQPAGEIKEALILSGPEGQMHSEKVVSQGGGGSYQNEFQINLPAGLAHGVYNVTTQLYVNGQMAAQRQESLQVVRVGGGVLVASD